MAGRFHIIIDLKEVSNQKLTNNKGLEEFLKQLPEAIGMKILYGPVVIEGVPENPGITGFVVIDYSHISIHTFTDSKQALVDIFSCKEYSQETAEKLVLDFFGAEKEQSRIKEVFWG